MKDLIADKAFKYGTRRLKAGDRFPAGRADARVLVAIGSAHPAPVVEVEKPKRARKPRASGSTRRYQRRDMQAAS